MSNNLSRMYPELLPFWDYSKNSIDPDNVTINYKEKVWWICEKGHSHDSLIRNRIKSCEKGNMGCPYCIGRKVLADNSFATANPNLVSEWHPLKNGELTPHNVTPFANRKVWWVCSKGHEWEAPIRSRIKKDGKTMGCKKCYDESRKYKV